jgi:plasmid stabilization system protein ParE
MPEGREFDLHPEAAQDITDIWEFIASDNLQAAGRVRADILSTIRKLVASRIRDTNARISHPVRCGSSGSGSILSPTLRMKSRCGSLPSCTAAATLELWPRSSEAENRVSRMDALGFFS